MTERIEKEAGRTFFSKNVGERHNRSRAIATKTTILSHPDSKVGKDPIVL